MASLKTARGLAELNNCPMFRSYVQKELSKEVK